ncbi:MAG: NTE family protein [Candidatus Peregrinibacteria bacterium Greene0416_19]|nr:MAG: NTE family protein [Candidatus Peregrinibacteria bacterium Greene0416_19]
MTWGLVLSGGGAHGIANAGVIEVLEGAGLRPDCIAGSSMGAIVGALYATGHGPDDLRRLCDTLTLTNVARLSEHPLRGGLHGGLLQQRLHDHLAPLIGERTRIMDCTIPFVCIAARVCKPVQWQRIIRKDFLDHVTACAEKHVFPQETNLLDAILASSAIPVLFSPVRIGADEFCDIVHFGAIPARTLREAFHPDIVIATDTAPRHSFIRRFLPRGWRNFLDAGHVELDASRQACDLLIAPEMPYGYMRFDRAMDFYEAGKRAAEEMLPAILKKLEQET